MSIRVLIRAACGAAVCALGAAQLGMGSTLAYAGDAWCGSIYGPDGGYVTCAYKDLEQCVAATRGVGGICYVNPGYLAPAGSPVRKSPR